MSVAICSVSGTFKSTNFSWTSFSSPLGLYEHCYLIWVHPGHTGTLPGASSGGPLYRASTTDSSVVSLAIKDCTAARSDCT